MTVPAESADAAAPRAWRRAAVIAGIWLVTSLLFLPQSLLIDAKQPQPHAWWMVFASNFSVFMLWALLTPPVLSLARRHPFERGRLGHAVLLHLGYAVLFALLHVLLATALHGVFLAGKLPLWALAVNLLVGLGATDVLLYFGVVAAGHALAYLERYRAGERARADAQLAALRAQLHPHFLFNALNAISELVHRDAAQAERLILRLADLLRRVLASGAAHEVTLAEELDFTRAYLELQQALMGERLRVRYDIPDALAAARVPALLLQPLIENAVRHGLAPLRAGGELRIAAAALANVLELSVSDDGAGSAQPVHEGIGLSNTRARLATLYGEAAALEVDTGGPGFQVRVRLPLRYGAA